MAVFPLSELLTTWLDSKRALRVQHDTELRNIWYFTGSEIRDTVQRIEEKDISKLSEISLHVINTLDKPVRLRIYSDAGPNDPTNTNWLRIWNGEKWLGTPDFELIIPPDSTNYCINTMWTFLNHIKLRGLRLSVQCDEAPTKGTLGVKLTGR